MSGSSSKLQSVPRNTVIKKEAIELEEIGEDSVQHANFNQYMSNRINKLMHQVHDDVNKKSNLFNGISIYVNGYTEPPALELRRLIVENGGSYHHYYSYGKTTYVVAMNLAQSKKDSLRKNEKVIKPEWILQSLQSDSLLPERDFLLNPPEMENGINKLKFTVGPSKEPHQVPKTAPILFINVGRPKAPLKKGRLNKRTPTPPGPSQPSILNFVTLHKSPREPEKGAKKSRNILQTNNTLQQNHPKIILPDRWARNKGMQSSKLPDNSFSADKSKIPSSNEKTALPDENADTKMLKLKVDKENKKIIINGLELFYTKGPTLQDTKSLTQLFLNFLENSQFFDTKKVVQFMERILCQQKKMDSTPEAVNVNMDWLIVLAQLKATINHSCIADHGLRIFMLNEKT